MKVAGIVAEYNPFHNGHKYHIEQTKKELSATHTVAVMSGDFVMRGEPALKDKLARAEAAVKSGVDLVIELPVCYALASAEYFSYGAVYILNALGCVDFLSFGSEEGSLDSLKEIADILSSEGIGENIKEEMKKGIPVFSAISNLLPEYKEILSEPNNILAINYLKALKKIESDIIPHTVKREGDGYNSESVTSSFASAKAIRNMLSLGTDITEHLPEESAPLFTSCVFEHDFDKLVTYALRMADEAFLKKIPDVSEGLECLIKKSAFSGNTIKDIADGIKSKRYAYTRIKRIIYNSLIGITEESRKRNPEYIRVLAFNEKGREILSAARKKAILPVITNVTKKDFLLYPGIAEDYRASAVYSSVSGGGYGLKAIKTEE